MSFTPTTAIQQHRRFSVAPMMEWTTPAFRYFARLLSKEALLYTEMVTTGAILFGKDPDRFLTYNDEEHPLALQLGGSDPEQLAKCSGIATGFVTMRSILMWVVLAIGCKTI